MSATLEQICLVRQICNEYGKGSVPFLQRKLKLSYDEAKHLLDEYGYTTHKEQINNRFH